MDVVILGATHLKFPGRDSGHEVHLVGRPHIPRQSTKPSRRWYTPPKGGIPQVRTRE
ncbi:MAG: hypothetical protein ACTSU5_04830 [Promethearchaeota archaeon]